MTFRRPRMDDELKERLAELNTKGFKLPRTLSQLRKDVEAAGEQKWLIEGIWRHGDYGILSAAPKAQKTYTAVDLGVAIATGTPWLGFVNTEVEGTVMMFLGEGGDAEVLRRVDGALTERGITDPDERAAVPIAVESRVPNLTQKEAVEWLKVSIEAYRPTLVILDPLYLAADSADSASVYAMGGLLTRAQHACQAVGASLFVNHHDKKGTSDKGISRLAGAGVTEWARVILGTNFNSQRKRQDENGVLVSESEITITSLTGNSMEVRFRRELSRPESGADSPIVIRTTPVEVASKTLPVDLGGDRDKIAAKDLNERLLPMLKLMGNNGLNVTGFRNLAVKKKVGSESTVKNLMREAASDGLIGQRTERRDNKTVKVPYLTPLGTAWVERPIFDRGSFDEFRENNSH